MKKRWIIRSLFIGLLTLCVVAWVGSWNSLLRVTLSERGHLWQAGTEWGEVLVSHHYDPSRTSSGLRWERYQADLDWDDSNVGNVYSSKKVVAGFGFDSAASAGHYQILMLPWWFLTGLAGGALWVVWRKTKPKPRGFPIEMATAETEGTRP